SHRPFADKNGVTNANGDAHIFSVDINDPDVVTNLTQQGSSDTSPFCTVDFFCGIVPGFDPASGKPIAQQVIFSSRQDVGDNSGSQYSYSDPSGGGFPGICGSSIDQDVFTMSPDTPNVIHNLTDGSTSDDGLDTCVAVTATKFLSPSGPFNPDDFVA